MRCCGICWICGYPDLNPETSQLASRLNVSIPAALKTRYAPCSKCWAGATSLHIDYSSDLQNELYCQVVHQVGSLSFS